MKLVIDTNVLLRYLLADDAKQAATAQQVIQEATSIIVPLPVLCEVVWCLARGYKLITTDIADAIAIFIAAEKVEVNLSAVDVGLAMLRAGGDFADGVIAYNGLASGGQVFATFDKKATVLLKKHSTIRTRLLV